MQAGAVWRLGMANSGGSRELPESAWRMKHPRDPSTRPRSRSVFAQDDKLKSLFNETFILGRPFHIAPFFRACCGFEFGAAPPGLIHFSKSTVFASDQQGA